MLPKINRIVTNLNPKLQKIIRNIGWLTIEKVVAMLINFSLVIFNSHKMFISIATQSYFTYKHIILLFI